MSCLPWVVSVCSIAEDGRLVHAGRPETAGGIRDYPQPFGGAPPWSGAAPECPETGARLSAAQVAVRVAKASERRSRRGVRFRSCRSRAA